MPLGCENEVVEAFSFKRTHKTLQTSVRVWGPIRYREAYDSEHAVEPAVESAPIGATGCAIAMRSSLSELTEDLVVVVEQEARGLIPRSDLRSCCFKPRFRWDAARILGGSSELWTASRTGGLTAEWSSGARPAPRSSARVRVASVGSNSP